MMVLFYKQSWNERFFKNSNCLPCAVLHVPAISSSRPVDCSTSCRNGHSLWPFRQKNLKKCSGTAMKFFFFESCTNLFVLQDALAQATQVAEERIANVRTVRAFGQENREFARYDERIEHVLELGYKEAKAKGIFFALVILFSRYKNYLKTL